MIIQPTTDGLIINKKEGMVMKKMALLVLISTLICLPGCSKQSDIHDLDINQVKGWEHWENGSEVGIELQTSDGTWVLTKEPYTTEVTVTYEEN